MDIQIFTEWLRRQGFRTFQTQSSMWYEAGPRVLQAYPYYWLITPSDEEIRTLLVKNSLIALRYSTPLEAQEGMVSYHVILKNPYNLEMLRSQARNGVKKGMKCFHIERIPFERLADEGWNLQQDTLERQGRLKSMNQKCWQRICLSARDLPGFEAWAAISEEGELASALFTARNNDTFCVPYAANHRKFLNNHVNNFLFYTVSVELLSRPEIKTVFFCLHSLDAPASVDEFKFRMGMIARPVRQRVVFHPWLSRFANEHTHALLDKLTRRFPTSATFAKAEGIFRFYLKGKVPLVDQEWPEPLAEERTRYLGISDSTTLPAQTL